MSNHQAFSDTYFVARQRFREAALRRGARLQSFSIATTGPSGEELTIDVARIGDEQARSVVVTTSGLHGIEGFFGSAIQLASMSSERIDSARSDVAIVHVHGVNPFGFAWRRRWNEENIDLNRNFLRPLELYQGAPNGYRDLDDFLNPKSGPRPFELFPLRAMWIICRRGMSALKDAVAVGQYEYESGLFFGGRTTAESTSIVQREFLRWVGLGETIVHIDFHSGLGKFGQCRLLLVEPESSPNLRWYATTFGPHRVEPVSGKTAYPARGLMGSWLATARADRRFRFVVAEFGTHSIIRVLGALRSENRTHLYCQPTDSAYEAAKAELMECFCPAAGKWRRSVVLDGVKLIERSVKVSSQPE